MRTPMNRRNFALWSLALPALSACGIAHYSPPADGPGMIVTYNNVIKGTSIDLIEARTASGRGFPTAGSLGPDKNPMTGGKTMGAAPDGRTLPEWVEFDWKEWPYPYPEPPPFSDQEATKAWSDGVKAMSKSLPVHTERVPVRARVPQDVVDAVVASKGTFVAGKPADKDLWVYFIWHESGIKFRWRMTQGKTLRAGGDAVSGAQDQ